MDFGERLHELRKSHGLTMAELAELVPIGKSAIGNYEHGIRFPTKEILEALADYFNVDMDYLLGRTDIKNRFSIENKRFPTDVAQLVEKYSRLDTLDKGKVHGYVDNLLESENYKKKETASAV